MDASIIIAAASAVSALGQLQAGAAANRAGKFNAAVARDNARAARAAASEKATRERRLGRKRQGELRLRGVSLDLLEDSAMEEELAVQSILHGGEVQAVGFGRTERLERMKGRAAQTAGIVGAGSTLLLGGAQSGLFDKETA